MLKAGSAVDATLIAAPSSTKNGSGTRDPEMQSTQKGGNWYFGMKMHVGVDADSGLVHTVIGTAANVHDITVAQALYADAGYQGIEKRCETDAVRWHVAMRPAKRRKLDLSDSLDAIYDQIERLKAGIRAKVEHPFRVLKRQFGYTKTRYRGLVKNTAQITTLFALSNLWMARRALRKARNTALMKVICLVGALRCAEKPWHSTHQQSLEAEAALDVKDSASKAGFADLP
jgi:IS5 family transposase